MSIKANELRVENLVKPTLSQYGEIYVKVESIELECINESFRPYNYEDIDPIPLTPEILEKAGFARMNYQDSEWWETEWPIIGELCTSDDGIYVFDCDTDKLRITSLHQLQNLYHSLTGEELIVKF